MKGALPASELPSPSIRLIGFPTQGTGKVVAVIQSPRPSASGKCRSTARTAAQTISTAQRPMVAMSRRPVI